VAFLHGTLKHLIREALAHGYRGAKVFVIERKESGADMKNCAQEVRSNNSRSDKLDFRAVALVTFTVAASICNGAAPTQDTTEPIWPTKGWQTSTPEEQGMDSKELAELVDFGARRILATPGVTLSSLFDSLLVVRHGKIVAEAYYAPYAAGIPHTINSVTKAVISILTAIASKDGLLDSPNHRVLDFFDRRSIANVDDRKEAITVQSLLDMTSGLEWTEPLDGRPVSPIEMERSPDWVKFILDRPMSSAPGDAFNYNSGNPHLLSAIITKLTGTSALEYAKAKLFGPLGITDVHWQQDPQGISNGGYGLYLQPRDMAKIGYLCLRNGAWDGKQLLPSAWIDKVTHAAVDMPPLEAGLRYSNLFWALPDKHVFMAVGHHGQVIMVFPDLDVVAVKTGCDSYTSLSKLADYISSSVKSDTALPPDTASANLLANKIRDVSTEKPTEVGAPPEMAAIISGKMYRFPPNPINVKSLSLILTDPQPHYDMEAYARDTTKAGSRFTGPIGLDGLYRKGELTHHGFGERLEGVPRVNAVKGIWQDDHTFLIDRLVLGLGQGPERWILTFDGEKLNVHVNIPERPEISIDSQTGG
jgi:CubicO group peptidase (beta-lactamase class C family)